MRITTPQPLVLFGCGATLAAAGFVGRWDVVLALGVWVVISAGLARWWAWYQALPAAAAVLVLYGAFLGVFAFWLRTDLLTTRLGAALALAVPVLAGAWSALRGAGVSVSRPRLTRMQWVALVPTALGTALLLMHATFQRSVLSWVAGSTDGPQHASFVRQLREQGWIDYSNLYPRGLHMVVAVCENAVGAPREAATYLQAAGAITTWGLMVLLLALTAATMTLARRTGDARWPLLVIVICQVALIMSAEFVGQFLVMAGCTTIFGMVVALVPFILLDEWTPEGSALQLGVLGIAVAAEVQLWTPVAALPAVLGLVVLGRMVAARSRRVLPSGRQALGLAAAAAVVVPPAAAALIGLLGGGGLTVAAMFGVAVPPTWLFLVLAFGVLPVLLRRAAVRDWSLVVAGVAGAVLGFVVVLGGSGNVTDLTQWYPVKMAWVAVIVCLPAASHGWAWIGARAARAARVAYRIRPILPVVAGLVVVAVVGMFSPWVPLRPAAAADVSDVRDYSRVEPERLPSSLRIIAVARQNVVRGGTVIPIMVQPNFRNPRESWVVSRVMSLDTGQEPNSGRLQSACAQVRTMPDPTRVTVVTSLPVSYMEDVLHRQGCDGVPVVSSGLPSDYQTYEAIMADFGTVPPDAEQDR